MEDEETPVVNGPGTPAHVHWNEREDRPAG